MKAFPIKEKRKRDRLAQSEETSALFYLPKSLKLNEAELEQDGHILLVQDRARWRTRGKSMLMDRLR